MMKKQSGVQYGRNRMPGVGLLCGMLVLLGLPIITLTLGVHLDQWIQVVMILLAFIVGGLMSLVAIFFGIVIPQVHYTRQEGTATEEEVGGNRVSVDGNGVRVRGGGKEVRVEGGEIHIGGVEIKEEA